MKKIELYSAQWCSACQVVKPIVNTLTDYDVEIVDVEQETDRAVNLHIRNIPVIRVLEDDVEIGRLVGNKSKTEIIDYLNQL